MSAGFNLQNMTCPLPLKDYPNIILGHGGGGKLSAELIEHVFLPAFGTTDPQSLSDSVAFELPPGRIALSTDSFVVQPLFFPGGCIGDLAVNGTVNDLAMSGARPLYLTAGFILEEGFPVGQLQEIANRMGQAARSAGVQIVTGDTKVVEKGHGDGCYINTAGVGVIEGDYQLGPKAAQPGDVLIVSGTLADHGMAIMSVREGLTFESTIESDCACLYPMVATILNACPEARVLRDPTRGGLAASLNEIAQSSKVGMRIRDTEIPVQPTVQAACEILGLDPLLVANEGKLVAVVPEEKADAVLQAIQSDSHGAHAKIIGRVVADHPGMVVAETAIGATRVVTVPVGEQLPRIC